jgi:DNA-binding NtrC family response regulator
MRRLRRAVAHAGPDPSPAVVVGETGAGKEHVARALHRLGGRGGPLVAVNVTELTAELAESQLFGHVRGAFTGADRAQPGLFRAAHGGTLFLDEIGELAPALQPKLLRALQEGEVRPVGATRTEAVDARIVAATNRELRADIEAGRFRRDLYARLALWELRVPALRERRADIPMWIGRFHRAWCAERERGDLPPLRFEPEAVERLLLAGWPDNLRGLDRLVHRLAHDGAQGLPIARALVDEVLGDAAPARPSAHDPERDEVDAATAGEPPKRPAPATAEELLAVIAAHEGSIRGAARWYGRHRKQVYRWLDAFGVDRDAL